MEESQKYGMPDVLFLPLARMTGWKLMEPPNVILINIARVDVLFYSCEEGL